MAQRGGSGGVPKFGNWDTESSGYTMYFDNVRKGKGTNGQKVVNPNDPQENPELHAPARREPAAAPPARPRSPMNNGYRAEPTGSRPNSSGGYAPPNRVHGHQNNYSPQHHPAGNGYGMAGPRQAPQPAAAPQYQPPRQNPYQPRAGAVPKFGAWDQPNAAPAEGFTVQFDHIKKKKEAARTNLPEVMLRPSPEPAKPEPEKGSLMSKLFGCFATPNAKD